MGSNTEWTNNEASKTKLAISELGYIEDQFGRHFCGTSLKRTPEINRGYFVRVNSVAHAVYTFCSEEGADAQIVNIGAGFDTLFWRLANDPKITFSRFVDVDCDEVIEHKVRAIKHYPELWNSCLNVSQSQLHSLGFHSDNYHAISQDATRPLQLIKKLTEKCGIDKSKPVAFVFECVLLYWEEEASNSLIHTLNKYFSKCKFIVFDLVNTRDKFSHLMQQSLCEKDTPLLGASSVSTLQDWNNKFITNGSKYVKSWSTTDVYEKLIDKNEKRRIEEIEFLDEVELLTQLLDHYCLVLSSNYCEIDW